jgi:hypothetical protein
MKKPAQVLFEKDQFKSIGEVERRLAVITEMQRLLRQTKHLTSRAVPANSPAEGLHAPNRGLPRS